MFNAYNVVKNLIRTEKGTVGEASGKYLFLVDKSANKLEIKKAIEQIYKVKVASVNTLIAPGKLKKVRAIAGKTPDWKKAVVTLKAGSKIEVT
ncbi:MAG: 50S ribosomal protein L23 [Candidatus Omnitrophota bacterium]|nr:50S ribosomal protein L23 [Candidatus Omnitrophota bacterium]